MQRICGTVSSTRCFAASAAATDATGKFQFNQQAGVGARYFFDPQTALVFDYAYWHVSNAGIKEPNDGVNAHVFSLGIAWIF